MDWFIAWIVWRLSALLQSKLVFSDLCAGKIEVLFRTIIHGASAWPNVGFTGRLLNRVRRAMLACYRWFAWKIKLFVRRIIQLVWKNRAHQFYLTFHRTQMVWLLTNQATGPTPKNENVSRYSDFINHTMQCQSIYIMLVYIVSRFHKDQDVSWGIVQSI